jgi:MFS family permease
MDNVTLPFGTFRAARVYRARLAWSVWTVTTAFVLLQFFLQLSSGEIIGGLMKSFSLTAFGGGILASSYYYIYVLLQTPAGILIDRYGPRGILSAGALVVCAGSMLFAISHTLMIALLGRVLMGIGAAFAFVGCLNLIAVWFPARRFALMTAIVETAGMFGAITGNLWVAHFVQKFGWRDSIEVASVFAAILSLLLFIIVRNRSHQKKIAAPKKMTPSLKEGLKHLLRQPIVWLNGVYCGFMFGLVTVFVALWAIPFFEVTRHASLINATLTVSSVYVGMAIGGPVIGWLDGHTTWRRQIMVINAMVAASLLFVVIFSTQLPLWALGLLLFFVGLFASSYVLTYAIANEVATPENRATSIGFTNMFCVLFAPILQPFIGFMITHLKGDSDYYQWSVSLAPFLMMIAGFIGFYLAKTKAHEQ